MVPATASDFMFLLYYPKTGVLSGVGFEPTPTRVDCACPSQPAKSGHDERIRLLEKISYCKFYFNSLSLRFTKFLTNHS